MFARDAIGFGIQQDIMVESDRNILARSDDLVGDMIYGFCELRDDFAVVFNLLA